MGNCFSCHSECQPHHQHHQQPQCQETYVKICDRYGHGSSMIYPKIIYSPTYSSQNHLPQPYNPEIYY